MKRELKILLIEDDTIELMKLNRAMLSLNMNHKVTEVNNGEDALELLLNEEYYPDIILLDLNMPKINGIEFLSILKTNESLKFIPTIILTTSSNKKDLLECYNIGIACFKLVGEILVKKFDTQWIVARLIIPPNYTTKVSLLMKLQQYK